MYRPLPDGLTIKNSPIEGLGLNPILQDPGLAIHPPMLYLGYVGYSIVFSLSIASLLVKNKSNECPTLTANMGTGGHNVPLILDDLGIRKLTPRECLNFQGFPKSYKFPDDVGQSQRYKQAGNAVTVSLIFKIAKLIKISMS